MAIRQVRIWPDPALKEVAKPVTDINGDVEALVQDLFETMYKENGVGLASTQIAVPQRVLVIDLDPSGQGKQDEEIRQELEDWGYSGATAFINPKIVAADGEILWEEGCLSVPGITETVKRKEIVTVEARDISGEVFSIEAGGLFSVALQHELDHLDGKVFVEYLSKLKRDVIKRKMQRLKVQEIDDGIGEAVV
jgi:peptide deformylase